MGTKTEDRSYRSEIAGAIHEMMSDAHDAGVVSRATLRTFDEACLAPAPVLAGDEIRAIREREHVSQPVFAAYLNVSRNLVSDWERGVKRPGFVLMLWVVVGAHGRAPWDAIWRGRRDLRRFARAVHFVGVFAEPTGQQQ